MNWTKINILLISLIIVGSCSTNRNEELVELRQPKSKVIDVSALKKIMDNDSVVLIDLRKPEEYLAGHLPNAINIWRPDIQADTLPYDGMMASKERMENLFSKLGIRNNDFLIIYDNKGSCDAARLWWILDYYNFENVALLDGGVKEWMKTDSLTVNIREKKAADFVLPKEINSAFHIGLDELYSELNDSSLVIIDSRSLEEYSGEQLKKGAFGKGRVPGSINIDWAHSINYEAGTFKSIEEIKAVYSANDIDSTSNIVVYCHSGVRSAHTTFVLTELLGYKNVKNYDGSWIQWSYLNLPLERD